MRVDYAAQALADLEQIAGFIIPEGGVARARDYIARIRSRCETLGAYPHAGREATTLRPGYRIIGFERRVAIVYSIEPEAVLILRIAYGGRDLALLLG